MSSRLGTPLPRPSPSWFWFVIAALAALYATWAAMFGYASPWTAMGFAIAAALVVLAPKLRNPPRETVQVDEHGVLRVEGAEREQIGWDEVSEIRVIATDAGMFRDEAYFALTGDAGQSCVVPRAAALRTGLLDDLRTRFPTLDNELLAEALASTRQRHFVIWQRSPTNTAIH